MSGTTISIHCEDLEIVCPHCSVAQREVIINRVYNPMICCDDCGEEFELELPKE